LTSDDHSQREGTVSYKVKEDEYSDLAEEDAPPEPIDGAVNILEPSHGPSGDNAPF